MIRQDIISSVIDAQSELFLQKTDSVAREFIQTLPIIENFTTIITGIRRCGKSTLMLQVLKKNFDKALYLNFEDIRLTGFEVQDFTRLENEIKKRGLNVLFFDEIQLVDKWEVFVHQLLNHNYKVFVSGSNANLLSREMGTHLTGRHLSVELFPFSFTEFLHFTDQRANEKTILQYMKIGGMPEYVKNQEPQILNNLVRDILIRDISVRYAIRDVETLKKLAIYLISNVGKPVSGNKLAGVFGIKSTATILEYFNYYRDSYLVEFLPQFSYSLKAQSRNPKKVYTVDNGMVETLSSNFSEDKGRKLENLIYQHLRRNYEEFYFFKETKECDFIAFEKGVPKEVIQVCFELHDENYEREVKGIQEAMSYFNLKSGLIVTHNQEDTIILEEGEITIVKAHNYLTLKPKHRT